ncbi:hypothetical protein I4U23_027138 [Adineta vaga]|nr:hypothetical protein I4U23_027138 [Adineta vaga]
MSCPFSHNELIDAVSVRPSNRLEPIIGQQICFYDQIFIWTNEHVSPTLLNQWRKQGDPLIDQFFQQYSEEFQHGDDTYEWLQSFLVKNPLNPSCLIEFHEYIRQKPSWFNRKQILHGQKFFLKNLSLMLTSILYYTLVLGYGFQQLNDVLNKTDYLSSNDLNRSHRRLVETLQMIATSICGDIDQFDETFSDIIRVRLLHGMVRYKIMKSQRNDIPINQEDSLITLLGFSFSLLYCIENRFHINLSNDDKEAYLHFWRYIGWLIGIDDQYLVYLSSYHLAEIISQSIFYHFYSPTYISKHMVHHILMTSYLHGKLPLSYKLNIGISQILLGDKISHALGIDQVKMDYLHFYTIQFIFQIFRFIHWLGTFHCDQFEQWIIQRSKQRLIYLVYDGLNYQLTNFSLFKNEKSITSKVKNLSLKNCSCQFYRKKNHSMIQTYDIGIFRRKQPFLFATCFRQFLYFIFLFIMIAFCTILIIYNYRIHLQ